MSLRTRLMAGFILLTLLGWSAASLLAWQQTRHTINELFDTQQMLFAKRLIALNPDSLDTQTTRLPKTKTLLHDHRGAQEDDALAFAIFSRDGRMVLNDGENGKDIIFNYSRDGFTDGKLRGDDDRWRLLWLTSPDKRTVVAVGQEWEYRQDMSRDLVQSNITPWLVVLPVLIALLLWLITRELAPLKRITAQLVQRAPDDSTPLATPELPAEVRPMVNALNQLFARINALLTRERRFTADAAHELRSPLAALKVQTEVVQLAHDDPVMREHALHNLTSGIDRATRLVDQLLTLSRLDDESGLPECEAIDLRLLLQQAVMDHDAKAYQAGMALAVEAPVAVTMSGQPLLLALLLRNLIDNAIRYAHPADRITLTLGSRHLQVADNGPGVDAEALTRLGERFYRPPGQVKSGSGLGLSIVHHIAQLHGMRMQCANAASGGFVVTLSW
ncbi:quorum sensing histidine kinase QseC [Duffyella gerundensis]|uniref:quorum sensing histidine kinase QseC n=1 Tax=Duffyella TaxID=3026546 RepID=UPI003F6E2A00